MAGINRTRPGAEASVAGVNTSHFTDSLERMRSAMRGLLDGRMDSTRPIEAVKMHSTSSDTTRSSNSIIEPFGRALQSYSIEVPAAASERMEQLFKKVVGRMSTEARGILSLEQHPLVPTTGRVKMWIVADYNFYKFPKNDIAKAMKEVVDEVESKIGLLQELRE